MKNTIKNWLGFFCLTLALVFCGCSEDVDNKPLEDNGTPPGEVTNISVENLPGKSRLTYTLPDDEDLLYAMAKYKLENGTEMEVKSSYYNNSMLLEGFTGQSEISVEVYAVNRSEIKSQPVNVTVNPDKAPIYSIKESLTAQKDFGGVRIRAENPTKDDIAILVMQKNEVGEYEPLANSIYTSASEVDQALRGFDTVTQEFAITIRDRWLNYTDTIFTQIKPLYEVLIPRANMVGTRLPNDAPSINNVYPISNLFDGETVEYWGSYFSSRITDMENHLVTFDIGKTTKLSRLHIWNFSEPIGGKRLYYYLGAMRYFRIWGANQLNDGDLSGWILLGEYEVKKPSGLPYGQEDANDLVAARDGADYEIPIDAPAVRYLRIQCMENWIGQDFMAVAEVQVFGNPNNN